MNMIGIGVTVWLSVLVAGNSADALHDGKKLDWSGKYEFISKVDGIAFHCYHGVLTNSYGPGREQTVIHFDDVSACLGHICLCGAGGYRISQLAEQ